MPRTPALFFPDEELHALAEHHLQEQRPDLYCAYRSCDVMGEKQAAVARRLRLTPSTVSRRRDAARCWIHEEYNRLSHVLSEGTVGGIAPLPLDESGARRHDLYTIMLACTPEERADVQERVQCREHAEALRRAARQAKAERDAARRGGDE